MTERKPTHLSFPDWIEHQIRTAEADGAFDNLPGAGKPLAGLNRADHELAWVAGYLRRENVDVAGLLPPSLALAKEAEQLRTRLLTARDEAAARAVVDDLNRRIDKAWAAPQVGPPFNVRRVDVERALTEWRDDRAELLARRAAAAASRLAAVPPTPARRRWWRRAGRHA